MVHFRYSRKLFVLPKLLGGTKLHLIFLKGWASNISCVRTASTAAKEIVLEVKGLKGEPDARKYDA